MLQATRSLVPKIVISLNLFFYILGSLSKNAIAKLLDGNKIAFFNGNKIVFLYCCLPSRISGGKGVRKQLPMQMLWKF